MVRHNAVILAVVRAISQKHDIFRICPQFLNHMIGKYANGNDAMQFSADFLCRLPLCEKQRYRFQISGKTSLLHSIFQNHVIPFFRRFLQRHLGNAHAIFSAFIRYIFLYIFSLRLHIAKFLCRLPDSFPCLLRHRQRGIFLQNTGNSRRRDAGQSRNIF